MIALTARMLRHRIGGAVATLVALTFGVVLLSTLGSLVESGISYRAAPGPYAADDLVVTHRALTLTTRDGDDVTTTSVELPEGGTVPAELAARVRQVPGVADVIGYQIDARPQRWEAIGIRAAPGADLARIRAAVGALAAPEGATVSPGRDLSAPGDANAAGREVLIGLGTTLGVYVMLLVGFVVAGTIGLSVRHRRRDLALLRAVAATPGQVRRMIVVEAALLALAGGALSLPVSVLATSWLQQQFTSRGIVPPGFPITHGTVATLSSVLIIMLVAMIAAMIAARRTTAIRPAEALGEAAAEPARSGLIRLLSGLVLLALTILITVTAATSRPSDALGSALGILMFGLLTVALLAPWINRASAWLLSPLLRAVWNDSGYLAVRNLTANARGMTTVLTSLVLATGFGGSIWFLQEDLQWRTVTQARAGTLAEYTLIAPAGLPTTAVAEARRIPGVLAVSPVRQTSVLVRDGDGAQAMSAQAVDTASVTALLDPRVSAGSLADMRSDGVAVSAVLADSADWTVGGTARFWLGDGTPVALRLAAVYERGLGFGDMLLPRAVVAGHTAADVDTRLLVHAAATPGVHQRLTALATGLPGSTLATAADVDRQLSTDLAISAWLNKLIVGALLGYATLAAANTMVMAALARRREVALLRLVGVTARQVRRMVHAEQTGLLGSALVIGGGLAAGALVAMVHALSGDLVPHIAPTSLLTVLGGITLLALTTTILPIGRLLRIPPVQSIGVKE